MIYPFQLAFQYPAKISTDFRFIQVKITYKCKKKCFRSKIVKLNDVIAIGTVCPIIYFRGGPYFINLRTFFWNAKFLRIFVSKLPRSLSLVSPHETRVSIVPH